MMRVLLVSGSFPPMSCGVGDYTRSLAGALARYEGITAGILTDIARAGAAGGGTELVAGPPDWSIRQAPVLFRTIRNWRPDVVHVQYPTQAYGNRLLPSLVPLMGRVLGAASVRTWHEGFSGRQLPHFLLQAVPRGPVIVVRPDFERHLWKPMRRFPRVRARTLIPGASAIPRSTLTSGERAVHRRNLLADAERLVVFFGFLHPDKGIEQLFDVLDPRTDRLIIAGEAGVDTEYVARLRTMAGTDRWRGKATLTGYLSEGGIADLLFAADVVALPFTKGGGIWNSSIHAATLQGTPVVTTSRERHGLDGEGAVFYVPPGDLAALRTAIAMMGESATSRAPTDGEDQWARIARDHAAVYRSAIGGHG